MSYYGDNRENRLTKVQTLSGGDLVRVVASGSSRNTTVSNLITALNTLGIGTSLAITTTTTNYLATAANDVVLADVSGGALAVTLPDASISLGKEIQVKKIDGSTNDVTVQTAGGLIDGSATATLSGSGGARPAASFVSDGADWYILNA